MSEQARTHASSSMNAASSLMTILFSLVMFHATLAAMVWLRLQSWAVFIVGPLLGLVAMLLLVAALSWLRSLWWRWVNGRMGRPASRWLVALVGLLSWEVCRRSDQGQGL